MRLPRVALLRRQSLLQAATSRMRFAGKRAVLAGASNSIGRACAGRLLDEGCTVIVVDDSERVLEDFARDFVEARRLGSLLIVRSDSADSDEMDAVAADCGSLDLLLNLHVECSWQSLSETSTTDWLDGLRANLLAPAVCSKAFLPALRRSPAAAIVHLGSIDGSLGNPNVPVYSVAKAGLIALTHVMAHEFGAHGIRVNYVARAAVEEDVLPRNASSRVQHAKDITPLRRFARADEVADAVLYLGSNEASFVTGTVLTVDGGRSVLTPGTV